MPERNDLLDVVDRLTAERDDARAERDALREALKRIEDNAESWHGDNEAKARALAVIAGWCREALERTP